MLPSPNGRVPRDPGHFLGKRENHIYALPTRTKSAAAADVAHAQGSREFLVRTNGKARDKTLYCLQHSDMIRRDMECSPPGRIPPCYGGELRVKPGSRNFIPDRQPETGVPWKTLCQPKAGVGYALR